VKLGKLAKQLRRDLLASPKKAGALGLMILVALYFWAPLVKKWVLPARATVAATAAGLILDDEPGSNPGARVVGPLFRWEKVRELIQKDERMTSAVLPEAALDPFRGVEPEPHAAQPEPETQAAVQPAPPAIDPSAAGLVLTSVVIGPRRSTAMINGKSHREGETIETDLKTHGGQAIAFRLARIDRNGIELESGGQTWRVELPRAGLAQGDEIVRGIRN
jgi:hypothetical protein